MAKKSVLFICLGNICRSPIADAVFRHLVKENELESEWDIDSAAIGSWHVGDQPDPRAVKLLKLKGIKYSHAVRQIKQADFERFQTIFGMDEENISKLKSLAPANFKGQILLLGSFDPEGELIIRDPYYDNDDKGFYKCYDQCVRDCKAFLEKSKE